MSVDFDSLVLGPLNGIFGMPDIWYRPQGQQPFRITGVFDAGAKEMKFGPDGEQVSDVRPILGIRQSDFDRAGLTPSSGDGSTAADKVTITGVPHVKDGDYQVSDIDPDGQGWVKLTLNRLVTPA